MDRGSASTLSGILCLVLVCGIWYVPPEAGLPPPDGRFGGLDWVMDDEIVLGDALYPGYLDFHSAWSQHVQVKDGPEEWEAVVLAVLFRDLSSLPPEETSSSVHFIYWCADEGGDETLFQVIVRWSDRNITAIGSTGLGPKAGESEFSLRAAVAGDMLHVLIPAAERCSWSSGFRALEIRVGHSFANDVECMGSCIVMPSDRDHMSIGPLMPGVYDLQGNLVVPPAPEPLPSPAPSARAPPPADEGDEHSSATPSASPSPTAEEPEEPGAGEPATGASALPPSRDAPFLGPFLFAAALATAGSVAALRHRRPCPSMRPTR